MIRFEFITNVLTLHRLVSFGLLYQVLNFYGKITPNELKKINLKINKYQQTCSSENKIQNEQLDDMKTDNKKLSECNMKIIHTNYVIKYLVNCID